jgi:eukaryotic-like serine/threonine-protein kinase
MASSDASSPLHTDDLFGAPTASLRFEADAVQRLGVVCLAIAILGAVGMSLMTIMVLSSPVEDRPQRYLERLACHAAVGVVALLVFAASKSRLPRARILKFGVGFHLVATFVISLEVYLDPLFFEFPPGRIPWVGVWILLLPLIVPTTPRRTLLRALASASFLPLVVGLGWALTGTAPPSTFAVAHNVLPGFLCAGLAAGPAWLLDDLAAKARAATERARLLGSYRLEELLGRGGMGGGGRARHHMLARPAAVKVIKPEATLTEEDERRAVERFEREAQATSQLQSPHTVSLFDYGVTERGGFYYVMELLDGLDLDAFVQRFGPVPPARAARLLLQACRSLGEAHERGMVHRDVKPANISVCRFGGEVDFVKVLDFGLVELPQEKDSEDRAAGKPSIVGTPAFMAPETIRGDSPDHRVDLYALGCVGFWLLTGRLVFEGSAAQVMAAHSSDPAPRPSERTEQPIPEALDALIYGCLAKEPRHRPASARQLADALTACLADLEPWSEADALAWWDEHLPAGAAAPTAGPGGQATATGAYNPYVSSLVHPSVDWAELETHGFQIPS